MSGEQGAAVTGISRSLREHCRLIVESGDLESKLAPPLAADGSALPDHDPGPPLRIDAPARDRDLSLGVGAPRLPPLDHLRDPAARRLCLERFAHHELMAIELFAWALLTWPAMPGEARRGFAHILAEEQLHLRLYLERLRELGAGLGGGGHSGYLWRHAPEIRDRGHGILGFLCAMGLTFEQANLDFSLLYRDAFRAAGDERTAAILERVHDDEIGHLRFALAWLRRLKAAGESDLQAYQRAVPFPLGVARAKGRHFDLAGRRAAGMDGEFIAEVRAARPAGSEGRATAWLWPNIGAERELAGASAPASRLPLPAVARVGRLWALLFGGGARLLPGGRTADWPRSLGPAPERPLLPGLEEGGGAVPWLATVSAEDAVRRQGLRPCGADPGAVRAASDKALALGVARAEGLLPACLVPLVRSFDPCELREDGAPALIERLIRAWPPWVRGRYTLKPRYGSSGRGRVGGVLGTSPQLTSRALGRLADAGGALLEPWLERSEDDSVQFRIEDDGTPTLLGTMRQVVSTSGLSRGNRGTVDASGRVHAGSAWEVPLAESAWHAALAAAKAGYRGYLGVDAFVFAGPDGAPVLRPVVEINARFTVGTIALGLLAELGRSRQLAAGSAWCLLVSPERGLAARWPELELLSLAAVGESEEGAPLLAIAPDPAIVEAWLEATPIRARLLGSAGTEES